MPNKTLVSTAYTLQRQALHAQDQTLLPAAQQCHYHDLMAAASVTITNSVHSMANLLVSPKMIDTVKYNKAGRLGGSPYFIQFSRLTVPDRTASQPENTSAKTNAGMLDYNDSD